LEVTPLRRRCRWNTSVFLCALPISWYLSFESVFNVFFFVFTFFGGRITLFRNIFFFFFVLASLHAVVVPIVTTSLTLG